MNAHEIKQRLWPWARQTVIFTLLAKNDLDGNPFESQPQVERAWAKGKSVLNELWTNTEKEAKADKLAMQFVNAVLQWVRDQKDSTALT